MNYKTLKCPACGQEKVELRNGKFYCRYCSCTFTEYDAKKAFVELDKNIILRAEKLDSAAQEALKERFYNLRTMLWYHAHAKSNGSKAILSICDEIIKIAPEDFPAHFYRLVHTAKPSDVVNFINHLDLTKHEIYVERIIEYLLNYMQSEYVAPLKYLVERTFGGNSLEKYQKYITKIEAEAERVEPKIYQPSAPRKVFISYAQRDTGKILPLLRILEEYKIPYFAAVRNLRYGKTTGAHYEEAFKTALDNCAILVFVASKHSCNFSCNALLQELPYVKNKELAAVPAEYKNRTYATLPTSLKKPRIEYRLDNERTPAADEFLQEFFADMEYCETPEKVLSRIQQYILLLPVPETVPPAPEAEETVEVPVEEPAKKVSARKARKLAKKAAKKAAKAEKKAAKKAAKAAAKAEKKAAKKLKKAENKYYGSDEYLCIFTIQKKKILKFHPVTFEPDEKGVVVIPDKIKSIEDCAFADCENLKEIRIGSGVKSIGDEAFAGCVNLKKVTLSEGLKEIGADAFLECTSLEEINLPDSLQWLGSGIFEGCESLKTIRLPKKLDYLPEAAFADCTALTDVALPEKLEGLDGTMEYETEIYGQNIRAKGVFEGCTALEKIVLPKGLKYVGDHAFYGCTALKAVEMHGVEYIDGYAFANCTALTELDLPSTILSIDEHAFEMCLHLQKLYLPKTINNIGFAAFKNCPDIQLYIKHKRHAWSWSHTRWNTHNGPVLWRYKRLHWFKHYINPKARVQAWKFEQVKKYNDK